MAFAGANFKGVVMKKAYYGDLECEVIADLGSECVISFVIGEFGYYDRETGSYAEPYGVKTIVSKQFIFEKPITENEILNKYNQIVTKAKEEVKEIKKNSNAELYKEKKELENKIKELKEKVDKYEPLIEYLNFLDGTYEYIVYVDVEYRWTRGIKKLDECACNCTKSNLASVSFRRTRYKNKKDNYGLYLGEYSDDSGSKYKIKGFRTLDEAKDYFLKQIENEEIKLDIGIIKECEKWDITCEKVKKFVEREEEENSRMLEREREKVLNDLKEIEGKLNAEKTTEKQ